VISITGTAGVDDAFGRQETGLVFDSEQDTVFVISVSERRILRSSIRLAHAGPGPVLPIRISVGRCPAHPSHMAEPLH